MYLSAPFITGYFVVAAAMIGLVGVLLKPVLDDRLRSRRSGPPSPVPIDEISPLWAGPSIMRDRFVGRDNELETLQAAFERNQVVMLSGGAGFGKSRLAAEFADRSEFEPLWSTAGIDAEQTLLSLASAFGFENRESSLADLVLQVRQRLTSLGPETLWVVDNLEDIEVANELASQVGRVRILVTTRDNHRELLSVGEFVQLYVLDSEGATDLLCSRSETDYNDGALEKIAQAVGYLPLALEMLAIQLGQSETPETLLRQLRQTPNAMELAMFRERVQGAGIPRGEEGVFATIVSTLENLPRKVRKQLAPLGFVSDAPISDGLLVQLTGLSQDQQRTLVEECGRRSVVTTFSGGITIHALTLAAIAVTNASSTLDRLRRRKRSLILVAMARARRHIDATKVVPIALADDIAHHESILGWSHTILSKEDTKVLAFANDLAGAYRVVGRVEDAVRMCEESLELRVKVQGPEHPETLTIRNNLALSYSDAGRIEDAVRMHEETLELYIKVQDPEHPETLTSRNNLAIAYHAAGRVEDAVRMNEETLELCIKVQGSEHTDTLTSRNNLAETYRAAGRHEDAVRMHLETLELLIKVLGPEHPNTLAGRNNLALSYRAVGRVEDAVRMHEEILELLIKVLGPEHPNTLAGRNNLAAAYRAAGRIADAENIERSS